MAYATVETRQFQVVDEFSIDEVKFHIQEEEYTFENGTSYIIGLEIDVEIVGRNCGWACRELILDLELLDGRRKLKPFSIKIEVSNFITNDLISGTVILGQYSILQLRQDHEYKRSGRSQPRISWRLD